MAEAAKTPIAGEWWIHKLGVVRRVIGTKRDGAAIFEDQFGDYYAVTDFSDWHHEPRCTGFDWVEQPAEVWPKYYVCDTWKTAAYIQRKSSGPLVIVNKDGSVEKPGRWWEKSDNYNVERRAFVEVTESEAKSRLKPPAVDPCEGYPRYWTTIPYPETQIAYIRQDSPDRFTHVYKDGITENPCGMNERLDTTRRTRLTREQAEALIVNQDPPADEWYIYAGLPHPNVSIWAIKRTSEDSCIRYEADGLGNLKEAVTQGWHAKADCWKQCSEPEAMERLGVTSLDVPQPTPFPDEFANVTTAIRALKEQPVPKRVPVRLWINGDDGVIYESPTKRREDREVFHDDDGFYVEAEQ